MPNYGSRRPRRRLRGHQHLAPYAFAPLRQSIGRGRTTWPAGLARRTESRNVFGARAAPMFAQECRRHPTIAVYLLTKAGGDKHQAP